jgi:rod shape-determining protein MreC
MQVTYLRSNAVLHVGDAVITSGLGGVFPPGLPLGTVESMSVDKTRSLQTALLHPAADFDHLEEAFVIQSPVPGAAPP